MTHLDSASNNNNSHSSNSSYADLTETSRQKLTELEQTLNKETGEKIALVAYRVH